MALLIDGMLNALEALKAQDSGVMDVSHGEGVDLTAKLKVAREEIIIEIEALLRRAGCGSVEQVAVTPALSRWHLLLTLAMTYRDAYFSQLNDRYKERWKAYEAEAGAAGRRVMEDGIGLVRNPLTRPVEMKAETEPGTLAETTYWVKTSWVGVDGGESEASEGVCVPGDWPHTLRVGQGAEPPPAAAVGWNVYAGKAPGDEVLQNAAPIPLGSEWVHSTGELTEGRQPTAGQEAEYYCSRRRLMRRG
jgi:hypothetical protein